MAGAVPLLMRRYGIRPWELDLFTDRELDALQDDLSAFLKEG